MSLHNEVDPKDAVRLANAALNAAVLLRDLGNQCVEAKLVSLGYKAISAARDINESLLETPGIKLVVFPLEK